MFYTRKGDDGKTGFFCCDQRCSKSSIIGEALGTLDEINSFLGICKAKVREHDFSVLDHKADEIVHTIQENLFIIQAQVAGADKKIKEGKVSEIEKIIDSIENSLSPIKSFLISGSTEISALFDFARTLARRAERRVIASSEEGVVVIDKETLVYLNRLSSLLYALARFSAKDDGVEESKPQYS
jgi:cob(I)alamin adenosyltransferase